MADVRVSAVTACPPDEFIAALTDFSEHRSEYFDNSAGGYLKVHQLGDTWADVTEGSSVAGGIWQRYRYDWSRPGVIRLDVLDSNAFGKGSYWEYRLTPEPTGGSRVDLHIHRHPTTLRGRLLNPLLILGGKRFFRRDLLKTVAALERHGADGGPGPR